jgi:hypothetical protein
VEFVIVFVLLLLLAFGIIDFGRVFYIAITLANAAHGRCRVWRPKQRRERRLCGNKSSSDTGGKYHVVIVSKYRRKALFGYVRKHIGKIFRQLDR